MERLPHVAQAEVQHPGLQLGEVQWVGSHHPQPHRHLQPRPLVGHVLHREAEALGPVWRHGAGGHHARQPDRRALPLLRRHLRAVCVAGWQPVGWRAFIGTFSLRRFPDTLVLGLLGHTLCMPTLTLRMRFNNPGSLVIHQRGTALKSGPCLRVGVPPRHHAAWRCVPSKEYWIQASPFPPHEARGWAAGR